MGNLGMPELIFILVLALLIFGPKKLPELGRQLGRGLGEFKRTSNDLKRTDPGRTRQGGRRGAETRARKGLGEGARLSNPPKERSPRGASLVLDPSRAEPGKQRRRSLPDVVLEHLEELRKRLVVSLVAAIGIRFLWWWKAKEIFQFLQQPIKDVLPAGTKLAYTQLTEPFMLYVNIALIAG